jgi:hypothetical protein
MAKKNKQVGEMITRFGGRFFGFSLLYHISCTFQYKRTQKDFKDK